MSRVKSLLISLLKYVLTGFTDPVRRPRTIIWMAVLAMGVTGIMIPTLAVTSTRWFCQNGCHKVQDDTMKAYDRSPHKQVSCLACHLPVHDNVIIFLAHKMEAVGELAQAITNTYKLPLNKDDHVSAEMPEEQCTQCHDVFKRKVTPHPGFKINHQIHSDRGVPCPRCHNRAAHKEDFQLVLIDPGTGAANRKHADFMKMTACFRCHSQDAARGEPRGECILCHTPDFHLVPTSHQDPSFFPKGHARLALAEEKRVPWLSAVVTAKSAEERVNASHNTSLTPVDGLELKKVSEINLCSTCHPRVFCATCHGIPMPHRPNFVKSHGAVGRANPQVCTNCHGPQESFCNNCHHGTHIGFQLDQGRTWKQQHPIAVNKVGPSSCVQVTGCHSPTFCASCHANGGNLPAGARL